MDRVLEHIAEVLDRCTGPWVWVWYGRIVDPSSESWCMVAIVSFHWLPGHGRIAHVRALRDLKKLWTKDGLQLVPLYSGPVPSTWGILEFSDPDPLELEHSTVFAWEPEDYERLEIEPG